MLKIFFTVSLLALTSTASTLKWNYKNADLLTVIEAYAKATGTQFVIDSTVRGRVTMINPSPISQEEAFNQLSKALAQNGFSWTKAKDKNKFMIEAARRVQRDNMPIYTEAPPIEPEHMATMIYSCKGLECDTVFRELRILSSSFGEAQSLKEKNAIIISDFTGNLNRIHHMLEKLSAMPAAAKKE